MAQFRAGAQFYASTDSDTEDYTRLLAQPLTAPTVPIPDSNSTPMMLKSINYPVNLDINQPAGMFVMMTSSMRPVIRWYGFDPTTSTMNLIQEIFPDQILANTFTRGRAIAAGLRIVSNTIASGTFAVSGSMAGIAYLSLPPLTYVSPSTITSYSMDSVNVVANVPASVGLGGVGPITDVTDFRVFDTNFTPDYSAPLDVFVNLPQTNLPIDGDAPIDITELSNNILSQGQTQALPFGHYKISCSLQFTGSLTAPIGTGIAPSVAAIINFRTANPNTYAYTPVTQNVVVPVGWYQIDSGNQISGAANFEYAGFNVNEIDSIKFVMNSDDSNIIVAMAAAGQVRAIFADQFRLTTKEPGLIMTYQSVGTNQQFSLIGKQHWEVQPNPTLIQNVQTYYNLNDTLKREAAVNYLVGHLGKGFSFIYSLGMELHQRTFVDTSDDNRIIHYNASSFGKKFLSLAKNTAQTFLPIGVGALTKTAGDLLLGPGASAPLAQSAMYLTQGLVGQPGGKASSTWRAGTEFRRKHVTVFESPDLVPTVLDALDRAEPNDKELEQEEQYDFIPQSTTPVFLEQDPNLRMFKASSRVSGFLKRFGKGPTETIVEQPDIVVVPSPIPGILKHAPPAPQATIPASTEQDMAMAIAALSDDINELLIDDTPVRDPNVSYIESKHAFGWDALAVSKIRYLMGVDYDGAALRKEMLARYGGFFAYGLGVLVSSEYSYGLKYGMCISFVPIMKSGSGDKKIPYAYHDIGAPGSVYGTSKFMVSANINPESISVASIFRTFQITNFHLAIRRMGFDIPPNLYITLAPENDVAITISGYSYETPLTCAAAIAPAVSFTTGSINPDVVTTDLQAKIRFALKLNAFLYINYPDETELKVVSAKLKSANLSIANAGNLGLIQLAGVTAFVGDIATLGAFIMYTASKTVVGADIKKVTGGKITNDAEATQQAVLAKRQATKNVNIVIGSEAHTWSVDELKQFINENKSTLVGSSIPNGSYMIAAIERAKSAPVVDYQKIANIVGQILSYELSKSTPSRKVGGKKKKRPVSVSSPLAFLDF